MSEECTDNTDMGFIWFDWWLPSEIGNHPAWNPKRERAYLRALVIKKRSNKDVLKWLDMEFNNDIYQQQKNKESDGYVVEEIEMSPEELRECFDRR